MPAPRSLLIPAVLLLILGGLALVLWPEEDRGVDAVSDTQAATEEEAQPTAAEIDAGSLDRVEEVQAETVDEGHGHEAVAAPSIGNLLSDLGNAIRPTPKRTHSFSGVVVANGQPVPYAQVRAFEAEQWGDDPEDAPEVVVDCNAAGEFKGELTVGEYKPLALVPLAPQMLAKDRLLLSPDAPQEVPGIRLELFPSVEFSGKVVNADGLPVEGAEVEVSLTERWSRMREGTVQETTYTAQPDQDLKTDAFGAFSLTLVDAKYDFSASHPEWGEVSRAYYEANQGTIELKLKVKEEKKGSRIVGTVYGPDGQPAPGATVIFVTRGPRTETDENGEFVLDGAEKHWSLEPEIYAWVDGAAPTGVELGELQDFMGPIRIDLQEGLSISGTVIDAEGEPVASQSVFLFGLKTFGDGTTPARTELSIFGIESDTASDQDGDFAFESLPPGVYSVVAGTDRYEVAGSIEAAAGEQGLELKLDEFGAPSLTVSGTVVHAHTGEPIPNVRVEVNAVTRTGSSGWSASGVRSMMTQPDGTYFAEGLPLGEYYFEAILDGYARGKTDPKVEEAGEKIQDFRLYPERTVKIVVVDGDDKPMPQASVRIRDSNGKEMMIWSGSGSGSTPGRTDDHGVLLAHRMPGGPCTVEVQNSLGQGWVTQEVDLSADVEHEVKVQLLPDN